MRNPVDFAFTIPIKVEKTIEELTDNKKEERRILKGIASTEDLDMHQEQVIQKGLDISYFLKQGFINYHHRIEPQYIIGYPVKANVSKAFYVEAELFKNHPLADEVWKFATILEKENAPRKLGFSIQGIVKERDNNIIKKAIIYMVSVTPIPDNPNALTWADVAKSIATHTPIEKDLAAGYAITPETQTGGGAVRNESLEGILHNINFGSVYTAISKIEDIRKQLRETLIGDKPYQEAELLDSIVDYFIYSSLLATNSIDDAIDLLTEIKNEMIN